MPLEFRHPEKLEPHDFERFSPQHPVASCLANRAVRDRTERYKWRNGTRDRELTANAVMVLRVLGLICAGMNARMKFGTLLIRQSQDARCEGNNVSSDGRRADGC